MNRLFFTSLCVSSSLTLAMHQDDPRKIPVTIRVQILPEQRTHPQISIWPFTLQANPDDTMSPLIAGLRQKIAMHTKIKRNCSCNSCTQAKIARAVIKSSSHITLMHQFTTLKKEGESSAKKIRLEDLRTDTFPEIRLYARQDMDDQKNK